MIQKMEHIGVFANNMDESIAFYSEVLGLQLIERVQLNEKVELAFLSFPGQEDMQLELIGRSTEGVAAEGIVNHLAFTVEDIEKVIVRLKETGLQISDEWPKTILDGRKIAFFSGPSGEKLELFQK